MLDDSQVTRAALSHPGPAPNTLVSRRIVIVRCVRDMTPLMRLVQSCITCYQWRVEERDDWRALLDSMQADRTVLQQQNSRLEVRRVQIAAVLFCSSVLHLLSGLMDRSTLQMIWLTEHDIFDAMGLVLRGQVTKSGESKTGGNTCNLFFQIATW